MKDRFFTLAFEDKKNVIKKALFKMKFRPAEQETIIANSKKFIDIIRQDNSFSVEGFLNRYSLYEDEGVAILGLAEGLPRIPNFFCRFRTRK